MNPYHLKAKQGINDADFLFQAGRYDACANRAYYACFHAAIALLARHGIENPKNPYDWTQAQFSAEIVHRRRVLPASMASMLPSIQSVRHAADYEVSRVSKNTVTQQLKQAKYFVAALLNYLEQQL